MPRLVRRLAVVLLACCFLLASTSPRTLDAQPLLAAPLQFATGQDPTSVVVGDLNGDGPPDLVLANQGGTVSVLLGRGDGTFGPKTDFPTGLTPYSVAIADLNADGRLDLAVANFDSDTVRILIGRGDGTFLIGNAYLMGSQSRPASIAIGDLNGDGRPDLAVAKNLANAVSVLLGNGDGTFGPRTDFATGCHPTSIVSADLDGDGNLDLATANWGRFVPEEVSCAWSTSALLGNGDGTFRPRTDSAVQSNATAVAVADLSGDERPDLAVASHNSHTVSVLLGNGGGTFGTRADFAVGIYPTAVAIADLDADAEQDLVVASGRANTVSVLLGRGDGTFGPKSDYGAGSYPTCVAVADVNGDGKPDVAVGNGSSSTVSVLLNRSGTVPVLVEDLEASARDGGVLLTWRLGVETRRGLLGVEVQRSENAGGTYRELSASPLEPDASMSFKDSGVEPARTYWYRLVLLEQGGSEITTSPLRVSVPGGAWFTDLHVVAPPASGSVEIHYRIARSGTPIRLEIYDVAGRRIRLLDRVVRERGEYVHRWNRLDDNGGHVVRGMYLVRLEASEIGISQKFVLARE